MFCVQWRSGNSDQIMARRPASRYGSGLSNTEFTTLKIAVFAPMAKANVRMAAAVNPGLLASMRTAYRRSRNIGCLQTSRQSISQGNPMARRTGRVNL
jgi:hypothetical protein